MPYIDYYNEQNQANIHSANAAANVVRLLFWPKTDSKFGHVALTTFSNAGLERSAKSYKIGKDHPDVNRENFPGIYLSAWPNVCKDSSNGGCHKNKSDHYHTYQEDKRAEGDREPTIIDLHLSEETITQLNRYAAYVLSQAPKWRLDFFSRRSANISARCCSTVIIDALIHAMRASGQHESIKNLFENRVSLSSALYYAGFLRASSMAYQTLAESDGSALLKSTAKTFVFLTLAYASARVFLPAVIVSPEQLQTLTERAQAELARNPAEKPALCPIM